MATAIGENFGEHNPGNDFKLNQSERIFAKIFSYIFHPVFVPLYVVAFLLYVHPSAFTSFDAVAKRQTFIIIAVNLVFFPLLSVLLLRALKFIDSIYLRTQKDRIIPYIASGIFFFWGYTVFKQQPAYPLILTSFVLGIFLASSACLMANIYFKISMHATGMGSWLGVFIILLFQNEMLMTWPLAAVVLFTGLVFSSRLLLSTHAKKDMYAGLLVGLLTQFIAAFVIG
jgi:hypothetical protein